jgi:hypothetical protein
MPSGMSAVSSIAVAPEPFRGRQLWAISGHFHHWPDTVGEHASLDYESNVRGIRIAGNRRPASVNGSPFGPRRTDQAAGEKVAAARMAVAVLKAAVTFGIVVVCRAVRNFV